MVMVRPGVLPNQQALASTEKARPASKGRTMEGTGGKPGRGFSAGDSGLE